VTATAVTQDVEITEEYLRSLSMKELIPFLASNGVQVPTSAQITAETVVDWVIENIAE
jgi:hypothetical protein